MRSASHKRKSRFSELKKTAQEMQDALQACLDYLLLDSMMAEDAAPEIKAIRKAISKAKGEA